MSQSNSNSPQPLSVKHFDPVSRRWVYGDSLTICVHGVSENQQCSVCDKAAERMPK